MLRDHEISKNFGQTKKSIEIEVNGLLVGNGSSKRRETGEAKAISGFKLGGQEDSRLQERIPLKVWKMLTPEARIIIRYGGESKIGIVKKGGAKEHRHGGGEFSSQNKKLRNKLLRLTTNDGKQDPSVVKDMNELLQSVGSP